MVNLATEVSLELQVRKVNPDLAVRVRRVSLDRLVNPALLDCRAIKALVENQENQSANH